MAERAVGRVSGGSSEHGSSCMDRVACAELHGLSMEHEWSMSSKSGGDRARNLSWSVNYDVMLRVITIVI